MESCHGSYLTRNLILTTWKHCELIFPCCVHFPSELLHSAPLAFLHSSPIESSCTASPSALSKKPNFHSSHDMSARVAVVTGGNKGIGLAIVQALCKQFQGDVYLTARDVGRGQKAVESLSSQGLKAKFHQLDIDNLNSITAAAAFFKDNYGGVDVLVNNAAILLTSTEPNLYGVQLEATFKTNFFATRDMLTHFIPIVKAGGRVVNVSSGLATSALQQCEPAVQERFRSEDITEDELVGLMQQFIDKAKKENTKHDDGGLKAYSLSKTGLTVLSMILGRRLSKERPNDGILLNACCPGWVRTDMTGPQATKSPEEGAITPVYLALLPPEAKEPHGKFLSDKAVRPW